MNVKAEKLEQIIQIVNRNLLLVQAGQEDNVTPLEFRNLQRVDAGVFGTDKFAFEMVHFVKSGTDSKAPVGSLLQKWEKCFVKGLETLLVECAVVKDDIERDCFVSRVYCWFSEKLSERRALPRPPIGKDFHFFLSCDLICFADDEGMDHLRTSVRTMVGDEANTMKGLEKFKAPADASQGLPLSARAKSAEGGPRLTLPEDDSALHLPEITKPVGRIGRARSQPNMPAYNKQMYESKIASLLPDIPGAEKNYGLLFHKPESEAEIMMHEMWLARRRQEVGSL